MPKPYNIHLSTEPFDNRTIDIRQRDRFGLIFKDCNKCIYLTSCASSASAARLWWWRSELQNGYITTISGQAISSVKYAKIIFQQLRKSNLVSIWYLHQPTSIYASTIGNTPNLSRPDEHHCTTFMGNQKWTRMEPGKQWGNFSPNLRWHDLFHYTKIWKETKMQQTLVSTSEFTYLV